MNKQKSIINSGSCRYTVNTSKEQRCRAELTGTKAELEALKSREVVWTKDTIALSDKTALTSVVIPDGVTKLGYMALGSAMTNDNYSNLISVTIPDTVKCIDNGAFWFAGITSFEARGVTYMGMNVFCHCEKMVHVNLPNLTECASDGGWGASQFACCYVLETVKMPKLRNLGSSMFDSTPCLKLVDIHSIDNEVVNSDRLFRLTNGGTRTTQSALVLRSDEVSNYLYRADLMYVYVPRTLVDGYKAKFPDHADCIRPLEDYTVDGTVTGEFDETKI